MQFEHILPRFLQQSHSTLPRPSSMSTQVSGLILTLLKYGGQRYRRNLSNSHHRHSDPHIGHLHSLVLADVLKRFHALRDGDARGAPVMLTGTDEHGMKIQRAAEARNMSPIQLCDTVSTRFSVCSCRITLYYASLTPEVRLTGIGERCWCRLRYLLSHDCCRP